MFQIEYIFFFIFYIYIERVLLCSLGWAQTWELTIFLSELHVPWVLIITQMYFWQIFQEVTAS